MGVRVLVILMDVSHANLYFSLSLYNFSAPPDGPVAGHRNAGAGIFTPQLCS
jgi:hypothetical protein